MAGYTQENLCTYIEEDSFSGMFFLWHQHRTNTCSLQALSLGPGRECPCAFSIEIAINHSSRALQPCSITCQGVLRSPGSLEFQQHKVSFNLQSPQTELSALQLSEYQSLYLLAGFGTLISFSY